MLTSSALAAAERSAEQAIDYLINDDFTDTLTSGAVNGRSAVPGPGGRNAVDTGGKLSLAGGFAVFNAGAPTSGDPIILYRALPRTGGRVLVSEINLSGPTAPARIGFNVSGFVGNTYSAIMFSSSAVISATLSGTTISGLGAWAAATNYQVAVILRAATGIMILIKGGTFTNWTLLWISDLIGGAIWHPCIAAISSGSGFVCSYVRVPRPVWLLSPLLSDGFSSWGISDGRGHAEGIAGIYGSGGAGLAWTADVGTWIATAGVASASVLVSSVAIATINCGKANHVVMVNCTLVAGTMSIIVRWVDANNFVQVRVTPTNNQLVKVVAGVTTTVQDSAVTYVAGAQLVVASEGTKFRRYYNNVFVGAEQTIADAALQSPTAIGLRSTDTGNTFDNFQAYARGTGGEYSILDSF